jgi:hypothetical protein
MNHANLHIGHGRVIQEYSNRRFESWAGGRQKISQPYASMWPQFHLLDFFDLPFQSGNGKGLEAG